MKLKLCYAERDDRGLEQLIDTETETIRNKAKTQDALSLSYLPSLP